MPVHLNRDKKKTHALRVLVQEARVFSLAAYPRGFYNPCGMRQKIGRNDPCHCGSRRKYKKCCLGKDPAQSRVYGEPSPQIPAEVLAQIQDRIRKEQLREAAYGKVRPVIHEDFQGYKFVAVGNQLLYSKSWKTFPDFLMSYIAAVLGKDWGNAELAKPLEQRHQILRHENGTGWFL